MPQQICRELARIVQEGWSMFVSIAERNMFLYACPPMTANGRSPSKMTAQASHFLVGFPWSKWRVSERDQLSLKNASF